VHFTGFVILVIPQSHGTHYRSPHPFGGLLHSISDIIPSPNSRINVLVQILVMNGTFFSQYKSIKSDHHWINPHRSLGSMDGILICTDPKSIVLFNAEARPLSYSMVP
jgi:hypothetical protein